MKKFLPLFVLYLSMQQAGAQYHPMLGDSSSKWCLAWNFIPVRSGETRMFGYNTVTSSGDTLMGAMSYKKIQLDLFSGYTGAWREDSLLKRVYYIAAGDSVERLLYDFSLNMGDSILVDFENNTWGNLNDGYYYVDSVANVTIRSGVRKYLRLHNPANTNLGGNGKPLKLEWIESVGDKHNPVYPIMYDEFGASFMSWTCGEYHESVVINNEIDLERNYIDLCAIQNVSGDVATDTCSIGYWGYTSENRDLWGEINIYPNPSNGKNLSIEVDQSLTGTGELVVTIADMQGKKVFAATIQANRNIIYLNQLRLETGMYLVTLYHNAALVGRGKAMVE